MHNQPITKETLRANRDHALVAWLTFNGMTLADVGILMAKEVAGSISAKEQDKLDKERAKFAELDAQYELEKRGLEGG